MSINLDALSGKLHAKIDGSIEQLKSTKAHLANIQKETGTAIQAKLDAAKEAVEAKKGQAEAAVKNLEELVDSKKAESKELVADWKANREQKKLEKRAKRAEKYAEICIELAIFATEKADLAILEAVAAQKDAEDS